MEEIKLDYKPRTSFLRQKIAKADLENRKDREYIADLCRIEDAAYRQQVLQESPHFYGPYSFLYGEEFGKYRGEYFAMLKEMSYKDFIRVLAGEVSEPHMYGGWKNGKRMALPACLSGEERKRLLEIKGSADKSRARELGIKKARESEKRKKHDVQLRRWWVENSGKA